MHESESAGERAQAQADAAEKRSEQHSDEDIVPSSGRNTASPR